MRRDFVANVGHELKTPLGALAVLAETLAGEIGDDRAAAPALARDVACDRGEAVGRQHDAEGCGPVAEPVDPGFAPGRRIAGVIRPEQVAEGADHHGDEDGQQVLVLGTLHDLVDPAGDARHQLLVIANVLEHLDGYHTIESPIRVKVGHVGGNHVEIVQVLEAHPVEAFQFAAKHKM